VRCWACPGAKVVGGAVAVPFICGACGIALAAATVGAPIYGVYRLLRHVRRPSGSDNLDDVDVDDLDVDDVDSYITRWPSDDTDWDSDSDRHFDASYLRPTWFDLDLDPTPQDVASTSVADAATEPSPPLPPRRTITDDYNCRVARRPPPPPPEIPSLDDVHITSQHGSGEAVALPGRLPAKCQIRASVETGRPSPDRAISDDLQLSPLLIQWSQGVHELVHVHTTAVGESPPALPPKRRVGRPALDTSPPCVRLRHWRNNSDTTVAETVSDEVTHL